MFSFLCIYIYIYICTCNKRKRVFELQYNTLKSDNKRDTNDKQKRIYLTEKKTIDSKYYLLDILPGAGSCCKTLSSHCIGPLR